jgi:hypothetical protein
MQEYSVLKLRYSSRSYYKLFLYYLCFIQFIAPLVHACIQTEDALALPEYYITSIPPSVSNSLLTSFYESIEVSVSELEIGLRTSIHHLTTHTASVVTYSPYYSNTFVFSQLPTRAIPHLFYYCCSPRSPPIAI